MDSTRSIELSNDFFSEYAWPPESENHWVLVEKFSRYLVRDES